MLVLITYDVRTESPGGGKRLRQVAKACLDYGQRVQNSVFECDLDAAKLLLVKERLLKIIDTKQDSLRFYLLGKDSHKKVEHYGAKPSVDITGPLIV
ncbi:MAG: CRISPR-associated endonuclease Cas2 [Clostridiales bacterium]|jgi:CRISPR-associated protein Cas2|nr:CRISPR-associated endonuclease Cas2 [Clostridiales bacterium]